MKKFFLAITMFGAITLVNSCKTSGGDPKPVLVNFMEALNKQDFEEAKKYATAESASILDMTKNMGAKKENTGKYDISKLEIGDANINGDMATIPVKVKENNMVLNYNLKKESGAWKVAFDKSSLMSMGMDAMKNNSEIFNNDSLKHAMEELKNVDMDSIRSAMDQLKNLPMDSINAAMEKMKGINMDSLMKEATKSLDSVKNHH